MEKEIFILFHKTLSNNFLDIIMTFFTKMGWIMWLPVFFYMILKFYKTKNYRGVTYFILTVLLGLFISNWISFEIKHLIQRVRPCSTEYFRRVIECIDSFSFPSTHASNAMTVAMILILFLKNSFNNIKLRKFFYLYILLVSFFICISRLYLGVHWFTDVLGGIALGILLGLAIFHTIRYVLFRFFSMKIS